MKNVCKREQKTLPFLFLSIQRIAMEYIVSFCTVICLYNIVNFFCNKYFQLLLFSL